MIVINILKYFAVVAFVLLAIVALAANVKLPQGYNLYVVQSGSMEPQIGVGSVVLTKPTADFVAPMQTPRFIRGDVITFSAGDSLVSHRVIETVEEERQFFYKTRGDANEEADKNLVAEENVVGKVYLTAPHVGRFVSFAKQPLGYFLMIFIPSVYVIISEAWAIISELRKVRRKIPATSAALPIALVFAGSLYLVGSTAAFFSDTETSTGNIFQAADSFCEKGTLFMIGDQESSQLDNPVDELNWPGAFGIFPAFPDPFVVGTNLDSEFPYNSNFSNGYATDFDVNFEFTSGSTADARLMFSWGPGRSGTEEKEVFLDAGSIFTVTRTGASVAGWSEDMQRFEETADFSLSPGSHALNFQHLSGNGTIWDFVKVEILDCNPQE